MREAELLQRLLYRDGLCLIIDKPAGLPVHAGPGGGANLEQYLDALRFGLPHAPTLAHRLAPDTSGRVAPRPPAACCGWGGIARRCRASASCSRAAASRKPIGR